MPLRARSLPIALMVAAAVAACSSQVDGSAVAGPRDVDQAYFFAGDIALYGQRVNNDDVAGLAYVRAVRRIDVCGLLTGDTLAKIGQTVSVGTLFAFNSCDAELKISGVDARRVVSVTVESTVTEVNGCDVVVPLQLDRLPGAPAVPATVHPSVKVEMIAAPDCDLTRRIADALSTRLAKPLPPRDAAAVYPARLAERDPCEVLSVLRDVTAWEIAGSAPYECRFTRGDVGVRMKLQPQLADVSLGPCAAIEFVGEPMKRRVIGVGYVDPVGVVIKPAVVAEEVGGTECKTVEDVMIQAASLYT